MSAAAGERPQAAAEPFPWEEALHVGLCLLRIEPACFWAMTPRELHIAIGGFAPRMADAPARKQLEELMRRFPDEREAVEPDGRAEF